MPAAYSVPREAAVLRWLSGKLKVPKVVATVKTEQGEYMITRAVPRRPLSALHEEQHAALMLQKALRQVQAVPIKRCPFDSRVALRLRELDYLLVRLTDDECHVQNGRGGIAG